MSLTKVLSFGKEIAKEILCIINNNISMKQALCILFSALSYTGFFQSDASKYGVNLTFYLANFGSQKYLNLKQAYFTATDIDLVGGKQFLTNTSYMNKGKIKFLQITRYHEKTNILPKHQCVIVYLHLRRNTLLRILDNRPPPSSVPPPSMCVRA